MSETQVTTEVQVVDTDNLDAFSTEFFGEKKVPEEAAKPDAEQDKVDTDTTGNTEAQTTDQEDDLDEEIPTEEPTPKKKTFQDRINELVKQREDEKRIADARIEKLQKEFDDKIAALQPKTVEKKSEEPSPLDQNSDGTDKYPLGEFDPTYIRDLTRFTLASERAQAEIKSQEEAKQREVEVQEVALTESWNAKLEPAKVEYPDFEEKGQALVNQFSGLDPSYARYLTSLLMSMDKGPDVLYYLASNPAEAATIVNSGAQKATLTLGRIEAKFVDADVQKQAAKPRITKAPPPPPQTRGSAAGFMGVEPDTDDLDAFTKEFFKKSPKRA